MGFGIRGPLEVSAGAGALSYRSEEFGIFDVRGGTWVVSVVPNAIGVSLDAPVAFRVYTGGNTSSMTVDDFVISTNGSGSSQNFLANVRGVLRLYDEPLVSAHYTIDLRTVSGTRYARMSGDTFLNLGWARVDVDGWIQTTSGGTFDFFFDCSISVGFYDPVFNTNLGGGTVSVKLEKSAGALRFTGTLSGTLLGQTITLGFSLDDDNLFNWGLTEFEVR